MPHSEYAPGNPGPPPSFLTIQPPIGPAHPHDANTQHMGADRWRMSLFSRNGDFLSHQLNSFLVGFLPGLRSGLFLWRRDPFNGAAGCLHRPPRHALITSRHRSDCRL